MVPRLSKEPLVQVGGFHRTICEPREVGADVDSSCMEG